MARWVKLFEEDGASKKLGRAFRVCPAACQAWNWALLECAKALAAHFLFDAGDVEDAADFYGVEIEDFWKGLRALTANSVHEPTMTLEEAGKGRWRATVPDYARRQDPYMNRRTRLGKGEADSSDSSDSSPEGGVERCDSVIQGETSLSSERERKEEEIRDGEGLTTKRAGARNGAAKGGGRAPRRAGPAARGRARASARLAEGEGETALEAPESAPAGAQGKTERDKAQGGPDGPAAAVAGSVSVAVSGSSHEGGKSGKRAFVEPQTWIFYEEITRERIKHNPDFYDHLDARQRADEALWLQDKMVRAKSLLEPVAALVWVFSESDGDAKFWARRSFGGKGLRNIAHLDKISPKTGRPVWEEVLQQWADRSGGAFKGRIEEIYEERQRKYRRMLEEEEQRRRAREGRGGQAVRDGPVGGAGSGSGGYPPGWDEVGEGN